MREKAKQACGRRLGRIEGQIRGIARMIEEDRYCVDVLTQVQAARAALQKVEEAILRDHVEHCVTGAIMSGDAAEKQRKADELVEVLHKLTR